MDEAQPNGETAAVEKWADWLVAVAYPFDFWTTPPVPEVVREPLLRAWLRHDDIPDDQADELRQTLSEEGQW